MPVQQPTLVYDAVSPALLANDASRHVKSMLKLLWHSNSFPN